MSRRQISVIAFFVLFLVITYFLLAIFAPFAVPILWAVLLVQLTYPLYRRLLVALGGRSTIAAGIMTVAIMAIVVLPIAYLGMLAVQESITAYKATVEWVQGGGLKRLPNIFAHLPLIGNLSQDLLGRAIVASGDIETSVIEGGKVMTAFLVTQVAGLAKNAFNLVADFFVMLFTLFFLYRDGLNWYAALYRAIPMQEDHKAAIFERFNTTVTAVVRGTILTAIAQGVVAGIGYAVLGVSFPVFLGALSAVLALAPFGGTALVWVPVAAYLFWTAPIWKGIAMIIIGAGLVGVMDNVVQPMLIGAGAELPVLFLFFASVGGIAYFGFIGLFLGPVLLGIFLEALQIYQEEYQQEESPLVTAP